MRGVREVAFADASPVNAREGAREGFGMARVALGADVRDVANAMTEGGRARRAWGADRSVAAPVGVDAEPQPFCGRCGARFKDGDAKFCSECGSARGYVVLRDEE